MNKSQSSIEFVIILGVVLFFFIIFIIFLSANIGSTTGQKRDLMLNDIAHDVVDEINIAAAANDGYSRTFIIPADILGMQYNITMDNITVFLITEDSRHAVASSIKNIQGTLSKGTNIIENRNGTILLNP